jgi:putative FmdB family regulatory protein
VPTYEYECQSCSLRFEKFQSMTAKSLRKCPDCGKKVRRLIGSGAGLIFKGSGFYQTDYRSSSYQKKADQENKKSSEKSSDKKSSDSSDASSKKSGDSQPKTDTSSKEPSKKGGDSHSGKGQTQSKKAKE